MNAIPPSAPRRSFCRTKKPVAPPHKIKAPACLHAGVAEKLAATSLPAETTWRKDGFVAATKDQGQTTSCEAHRTSTIVESECRIQGDPLDGPPDEDLQFKLARAIERARTQSPNAPLPNLRDEGSFTEDNVSALRIWGVVIRTTNASDGRNSGCEPRTINDEPDFGKLEDAKKLRFDGEYAIDPSVDDLERQLMAALAAGKMIGLDSFVDTMFEDWSWNGANPLNDASDENDPTGGGHATAIVDYFTLPGGMVVFVVKNSWGRWGAIETTGAAEDDGCIFVTARYLKLSAWGLTLFDLRRFA